MSKTTFSAFLTFTQDETSVNYREGGGGVQKIQKGEPGPPFDPPMD